MSVRYLYFIIASSLLQKSYLCLSEIMRMTFDLPLCENLWACAHVYTFIRCAKQDRKGQKPNEA